MKVLLLFMLCYSLNLRLSYICLVLFPQNVDNSSLFFLFLQSANLWINIKIGWIVNIIVEKEIDMFFSMFFSMFIELLFVPCTSFFFFLTSYFHYMLYMLLSFPFMQLKLFCVMNIYKPLNLLQNHQHIKITLISIN